MPSELEEKRAFVRSNDWADLAFGTLNVLSGPTGAPLIRAALLELHELQATLGVGASASSAPTEKQLYRIAREFVKAYGSFSTDAERIRHTMELMGNVMNRKRLEGLLK